MRKSELFDAYLSDSLSPEQAEELKKILSTEKGSKEFMHYVTESQLMCDILDKQQSLEDKEIKDKKNSIIPFMVLAAAAAVFALIFLLITPAEQNPDLSIKEKERDKEQLANIPKVYKSSETDHLVLVDGTAVQSSGNGKLTVIDKDNVKVSNGLFSFDVKPRPNQPPFTIQLSNGSIEVIGTAFDIIDTPESSSIQVTEGTVRFIKGGQELILNAGDSASADKEKLTRSEVKLQDGLELFIDGEYTEDKRAFRDLSGKKRTGWASWKPGDEGAVQQVKDENNFAIAFTKTGRLGVEKFILNGPFSLSVWTKPNGQKRAFQTMLSNGGTSWRLSMYEETFKAHFALSGMTPEFINSKQELPPNKWSLVTAVYDGQKLKLFINGLLDSQVKVLGTIQQSKGNLEVAGNNEVWDRNFEGTLDGVQVYSRALSKLEVLKLYQNSRP